MAIVYPPDDGEINDDLTTTLRNIAEDIEPARPLLAGVYRNIAERLEPSLPGAPFRFRIPDGATAEHHGYAIVIYPPDYDHVEFQKRLAKSIRWE